MNQIEELRSKLDAMQAKLNESASQRRRMAVQAELDRQSPNVPDVVRRLAVAELGSSDDVSGEVKTFLASESVNGLLGQPAQEKAVKSKRPKLSEIMSDFQNGNAQITMGR